MTDPKAPPQASASASEALPDEVEKAINALTVFYPQFVDEAKTIRAHIASQDATIGAISTAHAALSHENATLAERIAALEADNKRLLEDMRSIHSICLEQDLLDRDTSHDFNRINDIARMHVLAQTAEPVAEQRAKVERNQVACETCGGGGVIKSAYSPCHRECYDCNGTGRVAGDGRM